MKKLFSILAALMLALVPALCLAQAETETANELATYTQADGLYTFQYPATWTTLDRATIDAALLAAEQNADEAFATSLRNAKAQIEMLDMALILSPDQQCNIIVSFCAHRHGSDARSAACHGAQHHRADQGLPA